MRPDLPSGTVTFCFTDVEGSTRLLHSLGAEAYAEALAEHRLIVREACAAQGGVEVDTQGDAFFFAFPTAIGALAAASAFTEALASSEIRVRCGLHTGEPLIAEEGYVGHDVHLAARVASAGHGGQVLVSSVTAELLEAELTSLGSHRLKDVPEPLTLYQLGDGAFPPLKTLANSNLPTPASSFLGREAELREADQLLQSTRLLTISGPGGQGKTRFALELARRALAERAGDYEDGVYSSFFASLRDPSLVLPTIAHTLSLVEQPGESALDTLAAHLEGKKLLLLLDNLEHLLDAAPELSELLECAPGLTLLVTSREVLRIRGEETYALPPLPDDEGVALFCERARVEPSETIHELASHLEGLPLAIELAAARLAILTPSQLLERLSKRLDLLKGTRDADPRQQTLRATIEWSYDLLTEEEQRLFRSLSVFAGGCTLEAAEDVCGADLDSLQSLVDKSLLRFTDERFWMLETIREYAAERLEASGDGEATCEAHLRWVLGHVRTYAPQLFRRADPSGMHRVFAEEPNIRTAFDGAVDRQRADEALELVSLLVRSWEEMGRHRAEEVYARRALALDGGEPFLRAGALIAEGFARVWAEGFASARESFDRAAELYESVGAERECTIARIIVANSGDLEHDLRRLEDAAEVFERIGDTHALRVVRSNVATRQALAASTPEEVERTVGVLQELARNATDSYNEIGVLSVLTHLLLQHDRAADARAPLGQLVASMRSLGSFRLLGDVLSAAANYADACDRPAQALTLVIAAEVVLRDLGETDLSVYEFDSLRARVTETLDAGTCSMAVSEGERMTPDSVLEYIETRMLAVTD